MEGPAAPIPPYQICRRRFWQWFRDGTLEVALGVLAQDLKERGGLDVREAFIDGAFSGAQKAALAPGEAGAARVPSSWQSQLTAVS